MILYKYIACLNKDGLDFSTYEIEVTESAKSYVGKNRRFAKDRIGVVDTQWNSTFDRHASVLSLQKDDSIFDTLKEYIKVRLEHEIDYLNQLLSFIP